MGLRKYYLIATLAALGFCLCVSSAGLSQNRGRAGGGGGSGGGRAAGNHAPSAQANTHSGPAMTRPSKPVGGVPAGGGKLPAGGNPAANRPNIPNTGGNNRPNIGGGDHKAASGAGSGFHRPEAGNTSANRPNIGGGGAGAGLPKPGGGDNKPGANLPRPGGGDNKPGASLPRPGDDNKPGANLPRPGNSGASSNQVSDFLGLKPEPGGVTRPPVGNLPGKDNVAGGIKEKLPGGDQPGIKDKLPGKGNLPDVKDRLPGDGKRDINVGNVNVGNSVDYSKDQKAWVNNRHNTGNQVRLNSANRYNTAYTSGLYRRGVVGGYPYYGGWANRGPYYGWRAATYVGFSAFMGVTWANTQPVYYAYGNGGNVYYENDTVYVNGAASGTPEQYAQQVQAAVAAASATTTDEDWLPLGAFALSREDVDDSQTMIELAVNKAGVIAGTYYNEATGVSRSLKGTVDRSTQRVAIGFSDGKGENIALETGIYNLTQDEAPGLLHLSKTDSQPVLLVRLIPPTENEGGK